MAEPFLSEIRIMSFNFAPKGWALCSGQLLPINQNQGLFSFLMVLGVVIYVVLVLRPFGLGFKFPGKR